MTTSTPKPIKSKPSKTKAKLAIKKDTTITEMQYWLQGILEFGGDGWVPNADQWETIKEKIMTLVEDPEKGSAKPTTSAGATLAVNQAPMSLGAEIEQGIPGPVRYMDPPAHVGGPADPIFGTNQPPSDFGNAIQEAANKFV